MWVMADVFEHDISQVKTGSMANVKINAYPDKAFSGRITYIYPTLKAETRTVPVRIELANPGHRSSPPCIPRSSCGGRLHDACAHHPGFSRHRQRHAQAGAGPARRRPFRTARGQLGISSDKHVEVRDGIGEGEQGGRRRQLPDRARAT